MLRKRSLSIFCRLLKSTEFQTSRSLGTVSNRLGFYNQAVSVSTPPHISNLVPPTQFSSFSSSSSDTDTDSAWQPSYTASVLYPDPEVEIGEPAPQFTAPAVIDGEIKDISLSDYKGQYVILFWYPKDFTFVCPTEIIQFSDRAEEFRQLNCQLIAASTDTPESHLAWIKTPRRKGGLGYMQIPIMADVTKEIAARYGTLKASAGIALRGLFIITPEGVVEHVTMNNFPIGRNVDEAKRVLQAVQYVAEHGEVCPAGWKPGDKSMIADPEKSLDYFESIAEGGTGHGGDDEDGHDADEKNLVVVKSKKEYNTLVNGSDSGKVAVKYWAPWCGKCRQIAPHVNQLAAEHPGVRVVSFDTTADALEAMSSDLGVKGLPHFRFFKDGKEVLERLTGYKKKPLAESIEQLEKM